MEQGVVMRSFQMPSNGAQDRKEVLMKTHKNCRLVDLGGETIFLMSSAANWIQNEMGLAVTDLTVLLLVSLRADFSHLESLDFCLRRPTQRGLRKSSLRGGFSRSGKSERNCGTSSR